MNRQQLSLMLKLQGRINSVVNPDWVAKDFPFLRAVVVEGAEALEHHGWKWWKRQDPELDQVRLELIDILHFVLSHALVVAAKELGVAKGDAEGLERLIPAAQATLTRTLDAELSQSFLLFDGKEYRFCDLSLLEKFELMIGLGVSRRYSLRLLLDAWADVGGTMITMFVAYTGKNVLNVFRQEHGYKDGTYIKIWDGREDNEHLSEIMQTLSPQDPSYEGLLFSALSARYPGQ